MLSLGGADAVTAALKTAMLATGKPGVIAFEGSYHGLTYAPLSVSSYAPRFREPFEAQLHPHVRFCPWETIPDRWEGVGAVIVEPIQGRAGVRVPPPGFLASLAEACASRGVLLIVDEILTGVGRCGAWWRSVADGATADLICVGKALGGGLPVSACLGREEVMQAWGDPDREAIHTGTFYGDPLGAAAALATLDAIESEGRIALADERGAFLERRLAGAGLPGVSEIRRAGLMVGVQLGKAAHALTVARRLLERGYLVLPAGADADVVQLTPPSTVSDAQLSGFVAALQDSLEAS